MARYVVPLVAVSPLSGNASLMALLQLGVIRERPAQGLLDVLHLSQDFRPLLKGRDRRLTPFQPQASRAQWATWPGVAVTQHAAGPRGRSHARQQAPWGS